MCFMSSGLRPAVQQQLLCLHLMLVLVLFFAMSHLGWDRGAVTLILSCVGMAPHVWPALLSLSHSLRGAHCQLPGWLCCGDDTKDTALLVRMCSAGTQKHSLQV